jgi:predicted DNA-binding ribbon-helix-helix protein
VIGPRVERNLRLRLAPFAVDSLAYEAMRQRVPLESLLRHAALYYLSERPSGRVAIRVPSFALAERAAEAVAVAVAVELDDRDWERLEDVAALERVSIAVLMQHAAMLYVADADSGSLGARLLGV